MIALRLVAAVLLDGRVHGVPQRLLGSATNVDVRLNIAPDGRGVAGSVDAQGQNVCYTMAVRQGATYTSKTDDDSALIITQTLRSLQDSACPCTHCIDGLKQSFSDCESIMGLDCSCYSTAHCLCERCVVGLGQSISDCESIMGLDCSCYTDDGGGGGRGTGICADIQARTAAVNNECCNEPSEDCSSGRPATCNVGCAHVVLPFFADCASALGTGAALFDDVVALCHAAASGTKPLTCEKAHCNNHGACLRDSDGSFRACGCDAGWSGDTCDHPMGCDKKPCGAGHNICTPNGGVHTCSCESGWTGTATEGKEGCTHAVGCDTSPCGDHGTCSADGGNHTCICAWGWTEIGCDHPVGCDGNPCGDHGSCSADGDRHTCTCNSGWAGDACDWATGCDSHPCGDASRATCIADGGSYTCGACKTGWSGPLCAHPTGCDDNPDCGHGVCRTIDPDAYRYYPPDSGLSPAAHWCICTVGWVGSRCDTRLPDAFIVSGIPEVDPSLVLEVSINGVYSKTEHVCNGKPVYRTYNTLYPDWPGAILYQPTQQLDGLSDSNFMWNIGPSSNVQTCSGGGLFAHSDCYTGLDAECEDSPEGCGSWFVVRDGQPPRFDSPSPCLYNPDLPSPDLASCYGMAPAPVPPPVGWQPPNRCFTSEQVLVVASNAVGCVQQLSCESVTCPQSPSDEPPSFSDGTPATGCAAQNRYTGSIDVYHCSASSPCPVPETCTPTTDGHVCAGRRRVEVETVHQQWIKWMRNEE